MLPTGRTVAPPVDHHDSETCTNDCAGETMVREFAMDDRSHHPAQTHSGTAPAGRVGSPLRRQVMMVGLVLVGGAVAAVVAGLGVATIVGAPRGPAAGYGLIILGVVLALGGGLVGGNYAIGGVGQGASRYTGKFDAGIDEVVDEFSTGFRPEADTTAMWQVIVGILYVLLGLGVLLLLG